MSATYNYIELARGGPRFRGSLYKIEELKEYIEIAYRTKEPLYRSVYLYNEDAVDYVLSHKTLRNYYGSRGLDNIIIDIDKKDNTDDLTLRNTQSILYRLETELGVQQSAFQVFFSGTGYHIAVTNEVFVFTPNKELPFQLKETMAALFDGIDTSIYMRSGLYRVAHTINQKSNLYKIPLTFDQVMSLKPDEILNLAKSPQLDYPYETLLGDGELEEAKITSVPKIRKMGKVVEPKNVATCIQTMYAAGPQPGKRHNTLLRIIAHYRRNGIPSTATKAALVEWNDNSLEEQEINDIVEYAYNKGYKYGCHDELMAELCNPKCIYYRRKDYFVETYTAQEAQKELDKRLDTDFSGRSYDFAKALGLNGIDCTFYPGELITIFGPTGSCKTTLVHNIALAYNHYTNTINEKAQIPTLYLSLELSAWYMQRRTLQILSDVTKAEVTQNRKTLFEQNEHLMSHILIQTISPNIQQIQKKVLETQPAMVIVDYIDLVDTPASYRGEYEKIKYIAHGLSSMAVNLDIIIVQVSQVSREYSRAEILDLYAGKGSGAIENASKKVIGLHGKASSPHKSIELLKNTDGELFKTELEWQPSFRLRRSE